MTGNVRRSGWSLILAGGLSLLYFWLTDPRFGPIARWIGSESLVDRANESMVGTVVGLAASLLVLGTGLWLLSRRTA